MAFTKYTKTGEFRIMKSIEIDTYFGDERAHIEISAPMGVAAEMYFISINRSHQGSLINSSTYGWQIHLRPTTILQGDDCGIIIDLIEEKLL